MNLDYICRQDILEAIDELIGNINFTSPYQDDNDLIVSGLESARDTIEYADAVNVRENIHARWVWSDLDCYNWATFHCSNCLESNVEKETKYCPNCGARMDNTHEW